MVDFETASAFAKGHGYDYFEVSAKDYVNVDEIFSSMSDNILKKLKMGEIPSDQEPGIKVGELEKALVEAESLTRISTKQAKKQCC